MGRNKSIIGQEAMYYDGANLKCMKGMECAISFEFLLIFDITSVTTSTSIRCEAKFSLICRLREDSCCKEFLPTTLHTI